METTLWLISAILIVNAIQILVVSSAEQSGNSNQTFIWFITNLGLSAVFLFIAIGAKLQTIF